MRISKIFRKIKQCLKKIKVIYIPYRFFIDGYKYLTSVYGSEFIFNLQYILKKLHIISVDKYVNSLKDKHKGEKIFIVATGPSLKMEDLKALQEKGITTISLNGVFKIYDKTSWRPDYYVIQDYWLAKKYSEDYPDIDFGDISKEGAIWATKVKKYLKTKYNNRVGYVNVNYFDHWWTHYSKHFKYGNDARCGLYDFYTVVGFAISLADYMGAKEIYLLGVDCNYTSAIKHVGEDGCVMTDKEVKGEIDTENGMLNGYRNIQRLKGANITIYNSTRGGKIDAFPRKSFEDALIIDEN